MSSGACARFKQNAWKKEFCSNCYRPKEEHQESPRLPPPRLPLLDPSQGILVSLNNSRKKKVKKKKSVSFTKEESEVIGYGGVESGSDDDEDFDWGPDSPCKEDEREVAGEEEKALERLTKTNTDFNSVLGNLSQETAVLALGRQQKQTLQVTIQPFSMDNNRKSHLTKYLEEMPLITTKTPEPVKEPAKKEEEVRIVSQIEKEKPAPQPMPMMKTILIETKPKEETRANPEGRKTQITRGNVITKNNGEQVKNKLYIHNVMNGKCDPKRSITQLKEGSENKKTEPEINKIIINTGPNSGKEEKNNRNLEESSKDCSEVTVKVLKIVGDGLAESREMAGEPDGKADSDEPETPLTPPPRASFLHRDSGTGIKEACIPPISTDNVMKDLTRENTLQMTVEPRPAPANCSAPSCSPPPVPASPPPSCTPPSTPSPSTLSPPPSPPHTNLSSHPQLITRSLSSPPASPPARSKRPAPKPPAVPDPTPRRRGSLTIENGGGTEKKKTRVRATLRKLLRFGASGRDEEPRSPEEEGPPRPRPQIIHPLDLNKSAVQVLPPISFEKNNSEIYASTNSIASYAVVGRPSKPPPPPRSESLNLMERLRPSPNSENNVYANLGEGRCGITPVKPQRTGSLRDQPQPARRESVVKQPSPTIILMDSKPSPPSSQADSDNVYECVGVSSAPECDMSLPPYYGSETESDIYYPYVSFQNGECKTKMKRKERGIVHSTLEENYGAVIIANHDALTHLLNQIKNKKPELPKELQNADLKWNNFNVDEEDVLRVGNFSFVNCHFNDIPLTLSLGPAELDIPDVMEPLTSFKCSLPIKYVENNSVNGSVTILKRNKIERLSVYARKLEKSVESVREGVHILLQVVKHLISSKGKVNIDNFIVFSDESSPRAAYLPTEGAESVTVEDCLSEMVRRLIGPLPLGSVLECCESLIDAQSVLEVWLWGPASPLALPSLARWLDLERATFLNSLVCSGHTTIDREQLSFLVSATPKTIANISQLIEHSHS